MKNKIPFTIWLYGLPCSGKTTIGKELQKHYNKKVRTLHIDGDELQKYNKGRFSGFGKKERKKRLEYARELANLNNQFNKNVIISMVTPYEVDRERVKNEIIFLMYDNSVIQNTVLIYCNASLETCIKRDVKGMYKKAIAGEIKNFTGIDGIFQEAKTFDLKLDTETKTIKQCVNEVKKFVKQWQKK